MIAFSPQLRQYEEMGGPLARISKAGDMATKFEARGIQLRLAAVVTTWLAE